MRIKKIEIDNIRDLIDYNPETGIVTWKEHYFSSRNGTEVIGRNKGYKVFDLFRNGKRQNYQLHRVIFYYMLGDKFDQEMIIDHINGDKRDNRWCNMRLVTFSENTINTKVKANNKTGITGVCFEKQTGKYVASISVKKKMKKLGRYKTLEEAKKAREEAEVKYKYFINK